MLPYIVLCCLIKRRTNLQTNIFNHVYCIDHFSRNFPWSELLRYLNNYILIHLSHMTLPRFIVTQLVPLYTVGQPNSVDK